MISGRDVVVISNVDWEPLWQAPQEIAVRFGQAGNRVVFLENTGVRAPRARDAGRVAGRLAHRARAIGHRGVATVTPEVHVHSPLVLPPFGSRLRRAVNRRLLLPAVKRLLAGAGFRDPVVITFLPTDTVVALYAMLDSPDSRLVYYRLADFAELTPHASAVRASERRIVAGADVVLAQSARLAATLEPSRRVHVLPPSVNIEAFPSDAEPVSVADGPVVGYLGGIHRHVDVDLLVALARRRPDWSLVLVGPLQRGCDTLLGLPNVRHVGPLEHTELAPYVAAFDVGLVPYARNLHTDTVVPVKVGEYLAMGKPVVSTDLPAVRELAADPTVLTIADNRAPEFAAAVEAALAMPADAETVRRRTAVAEQLDWRTAVERLSDLIETPLGRGDPGLVEQASV